MLSLAYLTVDGADALAHLDAAAAGGFDAAGLRLQPPSHLPGAPRVAGDAAQIRALRAASAASGVRVFDVEIATLAPETPAGAYAPLLDAAAALGARFVQAVVEDPDAARATERFGALCDAAAGHGLGVALEFMRFRTVQTLAQADAIVAGAARPNGFVLLDALHLARSGGTPAEVAALPPGRIAYLQLCDAPAQSPPLDGLASEARTARLHAGDGALPLAALLAALPANIPISVEVPARADAGLPFAERARRAGEAARRFLAGAARGQTGVVGSS